MPERQHLLAIDPAEHSTGLSLFEFTDPREERTWLRSGHARARNEQEAIAALTLFLGDIVPTYVVMERDTNPNNRAAIESLAVCRRIWRDALLAMSTPDRAIFTAAPQSWQSACGLLGRNAHAIGNTKEASLAIATQRFRCFFSTDDESDATLMGDWWLAEGGPAGDAERKARKRERAEAKKSRGGWDLDDLKARGLI
jgi:hypothetical protein